MFAAPALADDQAIAPGASLTAHQAAHAFDAACIGSAPAMLAGQAAIFQTAFFFGPMQTEADAGYVSSDNEIHVTINSSATTSTCEMSISAGIGDDGADLYDSVAIHLVERFGEEPAADYTDGGVVWSWRDDIASYTYSYIEADGIFTLAITAES